MAVYQVFRLTGASHSSFGLLTEVKECFGLSSESSSVLVILVTIFGLFAVGGRVRFFGF